MARLRFRISILSLRAHAEKRKFTLSQFLKLDYLDPFDAFATVIKRSRLAMTTAYNMAFAAHERCRKALEDHRWGSAARVGAFGFPVFADERSSAAGALGDEDLRRLWLDALAEDFQSDQQAAPVILVAADTLQRFAKGVLGKAPGVGSGFGPAYGGYGGEPVSLTSLIRAATKLLRHVSEWDDDPNLQFPYPAPEDLKKGSRLLQPSQSINVLQRAFGIGRHEPIRDVVSMRVLVAVDGLFGTAPPNYDRFESAVTQAAEQIVLRASRDAPERLRIALQNTI